MRLNLTLRRRLERVEKRLQGRKPLPTIIMAVYPDEQPGPVIGIEGGGVRVRREEGELLDALKARAAAEIPSRILAMLYAAPSACQNAVPVPVASPAPHTVRAGAWALAGVGREASRDELIRLGATPVPPERLI